MTTAMVSDDSQAILLLCSTLALPRTPDAPKPLSRPEWNQIARGVSASDLRRPGALLGASTSLLTESLRIPETLARRMTTLLERGGQLAIERERLSSLGIWTLTRADEQYPKQLKERLKAEAPPVLFGAGPMGALIRPGLAIVGSRDIDDAGAAFAKELGKRCATGHLLVFSGGARGADRLAMSGALEAGGSGVAVLADSLEQTLKQREVRDSVLRSRLTLVTPSHPSAKFTVAAAMGRNKLIYAMAAWAAVVSSGLGEGGTWAGAQENLRAHWVPLFVRSGNLIPEGNRGLLERGALPLVLDELSSDLASSLRRWSEQLVSAKEQASLVREVPPTIATAIGHDGGRDLFRDAWPWLQRFLAEPRTEAEIASVFALERAQARAWLLRAVREGTLQKLNKPTRFQAIRLDQAQNRLFDAK